MASFSMLARNQFRVEFGVLVIIKVATKCPNSTTSSCGVGFKDLCRDAMLRPQLEGTAKARNSGAHNDHLWGRCITWFSFTTLTEVCTSLSVFMQEELAV